MGSTPQTVSRRDSTPVQNTRQTRAVGAASGKTLQGWSDWWSNEDSNHGPGCFIDGARPEQRSLAIWQVFGASRARHRRRDVSLVFAKRWLRVLASLRKLAELFLISGLDLAAVAACPN